ncbi:MAG: hypothetical protein ABFS19_11915 [Thermodesulfobacteriota bacterium]
MKNKELQLSVIKSGVMLLVLLVVIWGVIGGQSGGIMASFGSLFGSIFSAIQFLFAMVIAIAFSIAVIIAIYLGTVYLHSSEDAAVAYDEVKESLAKQSKSIPLPSTALLQFKKEAQPSEELNQLKDDIAALTGKQSSLQKNINNLQGQLNKQTSLKASLQALSQETKESFTGADQQLSEMDEKLEAKASASVVDDLKKITDEISKVSANLTEVSTRVSTVEENPILSEQAVEQDDKDEVLNGLKDKITALETLVQTIQEDKSSAGNVQDEAEIHRLLTYFKPDAQAKLTELVDETVVQEMSYAKAGEYLEKKLNAAGKKIIKEHPSLTKDFIRNRRQK